MTDFVGTWGSLLIALVTFVIGPTVLAWVAWQRGRRQSEAAATKDVSSGWRERIEGDVSLSGAVFQWSDRLRLQVEHLEAALEKTRAKLGAVESDLADLQMQHRQVIHHNRLLVQQVLGLGGVPVPPPEWSRMKIRPLPPVEHEHEHERESDDDGA